MTLESFGQIERNMPIISKGSIIVTQQSSRQNNEHLNIWEGGDITYFAFVTTEYLRADMF